jgi:predicted metal-dependent peptidase
MIERQGRQYFEMHLLLNATYEVDDVASACMVLRDGLPVIKLNQDYLYGFPGLIDLLRHELAHYLLFHHNFLDQCEYMQLAQIAMDVAINNMLPDFDANPDRSFIAKNGRNVKHVLCTYATLVELLAKSGYVGSVAKNESCRYYYKLLVANMPPPTILKEMVQFMPQFGDKSGDLDDSGAVTVHINNDPDASTGSEMDIERELFTDHIQQVARQIGSGLSEFGIDIPDTPVSKLDWRRLLRMFVNSRSNNVRYLKSRPSRRYGLLRPKKSRQRESRINVLIDVSGSMASYIHRILEEITYLAHFGVRFDLHRIDTTLNFVGSIQRRHDVSDLDIKWGGGTDFREGLVELSENSRWPIIFITDTFGKFPEHKLRQPCVVVTMHGSNVPDHFKVVEVPEEVLL